ncbi:MAG: glycosyltransferase family 29 protein [Alphaproteobacteria bacterium]|nr:glycosyltransferase family 29 protein [Alphaproteobacteria bacterium]
MALYVYLLDFDTNLRYALPCYNPGENMSVFRKERFADGRRKIYFMGVKILAYSKKKPKIDKTLAYDSARIIAESVYTRDDCDDFSYEFLKHWFQNGWILTNYDTQIAWLVFINAACKRNDTSVARSTFLAYHNRFGLAGVENYVLICKLAASLGLHNEMTDKTVRVAERVQKVRAKKRFESMIKRAKSVAIVGRSPILIGKKLGAEIDSHDIVIRFNMADVSGKYKTDFGIKNDVMVINCWNKNDKSAFCMYIAWRNYGTMTKVINDIDQDDCENADFMDFGLKSNVCRESGLINPTSGALMIMWVKQILGNLDKVDIYGFAFQDEKMNLGHYDGNYDINNDVHNMRAEIEFLKQTVNKGDKK